MNQLSYRHCSTCRTPIEYDAQYYKCSVSTCNRRATALYFCSVPCWDAHVPGARHRDAWAEVETAPSRAEALEEAAQGETQSSLTSSPEQLSPERPLRRVVSGRATADRVPADRVPADRVPADQEDDATGDLPSDVLVVMSKLKAYIKARSGLRTSDGVSDPLSEHLRKICAAAIRSAAKNERTTVLGRDIEAALRGESASE